MTKIIVDIMTAQDSRYIDTMRIEPSLSMITDYYGEKPVISVSELCKKIEERRQTLKGSGYNVLACNENFILNYD